MMAMISTVFPELAVSQSSQRDSFVKAFENPALIRSYLINPQETAHYLMQRFPEMSEVILKNMPFQKIGGNLEPNVHSGLYRRISEEVFSGVKPRDSFVRKEMDKLLSSFIGVSIGGSKGMETKAYEFLRNSIDNPGFTREGKRIEHRMADLMNSRQARQDLKEAQGLAAMGALPATAQPFVAQPPPGISQQQQLQSVSALRNGVPANSSTSTGGVGAPEQREVTPKGAEPPSPPSNVIPSSPQQPPSMRESVPASSSEPQAATPPAPAKNEISATEQMLRDQIAQLEARLRRQAETSVAPLVTESKPTAAPSAELDQLRQQNKELSDRLSKIEQNVQALVDKNTALEKENSDLKIKVADLERRNSELEKRDKQEPPAQKKESVEPSKGLSDHEIKERAKAVHDELGYFTLNENEEAIYSHLSSLSAADHRRLSDAFLKEYGEDMNAYLSRDLDRSEMAIVSKLQQGSRPGTTEAIKVYNILQGWTEKSELTQALKGKTPEELVAMGTEFEYLTGQSFQDAIKSQFWFESDRKAFLEGFDRAKEVVKVVDEGSPELREVHRSLSSLGIEASISETRDWATKNLELYNTVGSTSAGQREFVSYLKKAYGLKESEETINPSLFFNQKIAESAMREISSATTPQTIRPMPMGPGAAPAPITVQEPDREKIGKIVESLSDLPEVQDLVRNHPDVKKLGLVSKPEGDKSQQPAPAPKQTEPSTPAPSVSGPQQPESRKTTPETVETTKMTASPVLDELVHILNTGNGDVRSYLLDNKTDLFARTDEEVVTAFRRVNTAQMGRFAGSLRNAHMALDSGAIEMSSFTKADITRLGQVAALAKKVSEEAH
jgi:hypothetical protein